MACGGCAKRRAKAMAAQRGKADDLLMGGYKYLNDRQIKARLEAYKRRYCKECKKRYDCDYASYVECRKNKTN